MTPTKDTDLGVLAQRWGGQYGVCQLKHRILKDCVESYENPNKSK